FSLVPATSPAEAWYRSEAWKPTDLSPLSSSPETDHNAGDLSSKTRGQGSFLLPPISPEFGHTSSWVLLLTSPASCSDQPRHLKRSDYRRFDSPPATRVGAHRRRICERESTRGRCWHRVWTLSL
ncbi:hypothetical protein CUMW_244820, partial [Citrus unshiu]